MKTKHVFVALLFCAAGVMAAQETPKFDLFGGYSYGRIKTTVFTERGNLNGWDSSLTYNLNSWLGIEAEGSGHYGSHLIGPAINVVFVCPSNAATCPPASSFGPFSQDSKVHTYTFGPRFTWRTGHVVTPFAHFLAGGGHVNEVFDFGAGQSASSSSAFVWKAGVGFDLRLNSLVSWRTQTDLLHARFFSSGEHSLVVSTGPVFHFGRK
jgi:hypothetical protein